MKIKINGEDFTFDHDALTVDGLLIAHQVEMPEYVTVQVNEEIIDKDDFASFNIHDGDEVEFLYYMGGGK